MHQKLCCIVILLIAFPLACSAADPLASAGDDNSRINKEFISNLCERTIGGVSIMLPKYLTEREINNGKIFQDAVNGIKTVMVAFEDTPLENDLKKTVSSKYEFWEKAYYPGDNPVFILWNGSYKSGFQTIQKMERVELEDFRGFFTKGARNTAKGNPVYILDYILFKKDDTQKEINVAIQSSQGYFLSDDESNYIISTLRAIN